MESWFWIANRQISSIFDRIIICLQHDNDGVLPFYVVEDFENSVDPDQLASDAANRSGSALFVIKHVHCLSFSM